MGRRDRIVRDVLEGPAIPDPSPLSPSPREMMSSREEGGGRREEGGGGGESECGEAQNPNLLSLYTIIDFSLFYFSF